MNDQATFVVALTALVTALVGGYVAWRKLKPETANIVVTTAETVTDMSLRFAGSVSAENDQLQAEINALRADFIAYRHDTDEELSKLRTEIRGYKAENLALTNERDQLKARVSELEAEVARLKAER